MVARPKPIYGDLLWYVSNGLIPVLESVWIVEDSTSTTGLLEEAQACRPLVTTLQRHF